jgi:hypothetical protein
VWLALTLACASVDSSDRSTAWLRELAGMHAGPDATVLAIGADSSKDAWGRVVRARTEAPLEESEQLARIFDASVGAPADVVAGGPFPQLTEQVLLDAFALVNARSLPKLRVVSVSAEPLSTELEAACAEHDATCVHASWREALFRW